MKASLSQSSIHGEGRQHCHPRIPRLSSSSVQGTVRVEELPARVLEPLWRLTSACVVSTGGLQVCYLLSSRLRGCSLCAGHCARSWGAWPQLHASPLVPCRPPGWAQTPQRVCAGSRWVRGCPASPARHTGADAFQRVQPSAPLMTAEAQVSVGEDANSERKQVLSKER